ncbi:sigma-70 family RNA polymerase sigma factor [Streptomyces sp. NPDC006990]|uniref:sigma-70 family RNA polymerase sigma factor n=1 Tax=Streptomyces sp. NPDC006990 TaxID=3154481 RepID=UPI003452CF8F
MSSSVIDAAVIEAAQAGDERARELVAAKSLPLVHNIVGRSLPGHADVDDVTQETMLHALAKLHTLRDPGRFRSWLAAITMNQIRGHRRQDPGVLQDTDEIRGLPDPRADFVDATINRLGLSGQCREVAEATRWLEPDDRTLLSLWWLESTGELSRADVAAALEITPQHTAVRVQRMKAQLEVGRVVVRALAAEPSCVLLQSLLEGWDGEPSGLWRKRIARHARECTVCSGHSSGLVPAERLLVGLALVPPSAALCARWGLEHPKVAAEPTAAGHSLGSTPGRASARRAQQRGRRARRRTALAVAAVLATAGGTGAFLLIPDPPEDRDTASPTRSGDGIRSLSRPSPSASPSPSSSSASPSPSASPRSTSASPSPSRTAPRRTPRRKPATPAPPPADPAGGSYAQQVTSLVNAERAKKGCGPVSSNATLDKAALGHSRDMDARDYFSHQSPDGKGPGDRITAAGYRWSTVGENIARGQRTPAQVMEGWMNSPGHRANILNCSYKEIGVGYHDAPGGPWWTQAFAAKG